MRNPIKSVLRLAARGIVNAAGAAIGSSRELANFLWSRMQETESGIEVNQQTSMMLSTVYACVRLVSEDIAKLPLQVFELSKDLQTRSPVQQHWLTDLLEQPNQYQTGFEFREMQQAHLELNGMFFGLKTIVRGEVREILPLPPQRVSMELLPNWTIKWTLTLPDGTQKTIPPENMYYMRGLSLDGYTGVSPIQYQRETIANGIGLRKFGSKMFKNGAVISGTLESPDQLSDQAYDRLKKSFEEKYTGIDNAHKIVLLEEGTKFTANGMKATEAQFLESKKYSRSEICGLWRVPPHMIGDLERATFSNIEQQSLDYVINGLLGRVRRNEERMARNLLTQEQRRTIKFEHNMRELLRGDFWTRMKGYQIAVFGGWMNRNEVRNFEGMNPGPKELSEFMAPSNMMDGKSLPDPTTETPVPGDPSKQDPNITVSNMISALRALQQRG